MCERTYLGVVGHDGIQAMGVVKERIWEGKADVSF